MEKVLRPSSSVRGTIFLLGVVIIIVISWVNSFSSYSLASGKGLAINRSGSTGVRFSGTKVYTYHGRSSFGEVPPLEQDFFGYNFVPKCVQWAVVTTIHVPNESILGVSRLKNWCLVIVGDTITPDDMYSELAEKENVFFLSALHQKQKSFDSNRFVNKMPFKSFARKNVGYLFAVNYGAKVIYDFDDDNILSPLENGTFIPPPFLYRETAGFNGTVLLKYAPHNTEEGLAFNPFVHMNPSLKHSWPRGFPIDQLQSNFIAWNSTNSKVGDIEYSSIGVIQSLCNGDPDSDALFRLTRPGATKFTFERHKTSLPLLVPASAYSPYNAQATTHLYSAFWGLYLPITVPGRVTDIWRSYVSQRVMKEIGLHVLYTPPIVHHKRSEHDLLADFEAENELYMKTTSLLLFLDEWSSTANMLADFIFELWVALYEHDYIGLSDVEAVKEWLKFLFAIGYKFPVVRRQTRGHELKAVVTQPSVEGQPYRSFPHLHDENDAGDHALVASKGSVLKIIMMTMDEWPLLKSWVLYHGYLLGFEHVYILDGSTKSQCTAFLRYARDTLGANVIFTGSNLNQMESVMTGIAKEIAGASDYIIKMDTDEFLVVYDNSSKTLTTSISQYLSELKLVGDSRFGYLQKSMPSKDLCSHDVYSTPEKFSLSESSPFIVTSFPMYKAVFDSKIPFGPGRRINLGGHAVSVKKGIWTNFGAIHYHSRCVEIEVENCKRVLEGHGYIQPSDTDEEATAKLARLFKCDTADTCNACEFKASFNSVHKAVFYLKWLSCPEATQDSYYASDTSPLQPNAEVVEAMQKSQELFSP